MSGETARRFAAFIEPFRVAPGTRVRLARDFDPAFEGKLNKKRQGVELLQEGVELLTDYQSRLAAQDTHGVLVVLQALDAAGKDGTIRHVMSGVNPQGVTVHSFKVPSAEELNHDFLWRYQQRLPGRGEIGIFNRSHYEEVLVVRVHPELLERERLPPAAKGEHVWHRRYGEINDWGRRTSATPMPTGHIMKRNIRAITPHSSGYAGVERPGRHGLRLAPPHTPGRPGSAGTDGGAAGFPCLAPRTSPAGHGRRAGQVSDTASRDFRCTSVTSS